MPRQYMKAPTAAIPIVTLSPVAYCVARAVADSGSTAYLPIVNPHASKIMPKIKRPMFRFDAMGSIIIAGKTCRAHKRQSKKRTLGA
jgi:hypothetical protein